MLLDDGDCVMMMWRCWWLGTNGDLIEIDDVDISRIIARSLQQHNPQPTTHNHPHHRVGFGCRVSWCINSISVWVSVSSSTRALRYRERDHECSVGCGSASSRSSPELLRSAAPCGTLDDGPRNDRWSSPSGGSYSNNGRPCSTRHRRLRTRTRSRCWVAYTRASCRRRRCRAPMICVRR